MATHALDPVERASKELDGLAADLDLDPRQAVCNACHLVYWVPLGFCPNCP